jgi:hypothetical protein
MKEQNNGVQEKEWQLELDWLTNERANNERSKVLSNMPEQYFQVTQRLRYLKWLCDCDYEGCLMNAIFDKDLIERHGCTSESKFFTYLTSAARESGEQGARKQIEKYIVEETKELKECYAYIKAAMESLFGVIEPSMAKSVHPSFGR